VTPEPRISLVLRVRNGAALTLRCLRKLALLPDTASFELIVVDDASTDRTRGVLAGLGGDVRVLTNADPVGFGRACDQAVDVARGEHVVLLQQDAIPCAGWLEELVAVLDSDPSCGAVLPRSIDPEGTFLPEAHWLALAVRRSAYREVGGFDGTTRAGRAEKATLLDALRARALEVIAVPGALLLLVP
jgi:GT2 family glycosyltransferase